MRWLFGLLFAIVLGYAITQIIELPYWPRGSSDSVLAQGGCLGINVESVDDDPPVSQDEVEADVREQISNQSILDEVSASSGTTPDLQSVRWARYGIIAREIRQSGRQGTVRTDDPRWVLIFEHERDEPWWTRVWNGTRGPRFTVIYDPEAQRIQTYCDGPS